MHLKVGEMMDFEVCLANGNELIKKTVKNASDCTYHEDVTYITDSNGCKLFHAPHSNLIYVMKIDEEYATERK